MTEVTRLHDYDHLFGTNNEADAPAHEMPIADVGNGLFASGNVV